MDYTTIFSPFSIIIDSIVLAHFVFSSLHYVNKTGECWEGKVLNQLDGNEQQQSACAWLCVFLHWGQDKCCPTPHGQNKGWAWWTKNADSALSFQLAWKTTTCNRKQSYTVSSFLQTGEGIIKKINIICNRMSQLHNFCNVNARALRCVPDKDVIRKYINNVMWWF